MHVSENTT